MVKMLLYLEWYRRIEIEISLLLEETKINFVAFRISARVDICKASAIIGFSETQYAFKSVYYHLFV